MEAMRDIWTDERMDDLNHRVDEGFKEVGHEFRALRLEMRTEFTAQRSETQTEFSSVRSEMKTEFAAVRSEMAAMNRTLIQVGAGIVVSMFIGFAGTIATILAHT